MTEKHTKPSQPNEVNQSKGSEFWAGFFLGMLFTFVVGLGTCFAILSGV